MKILIVDDDDFLLEMYALKFKEAGFEIDIARAGKDAIDKVHSFAPSIVLLDIVLPEMDGYEVLQNIRKEKEGKKMLIIMLTNLSQKEDAERSVRLGADDYIVKAHFTPSEVVKKVQKLLKEKK
jgi:DNA-binding response OmpR family regulator